MILRLSQKSIGSYRIVENPILLLAGHNALKFDFPFLLCECYRNKISVGCFEHWLFVDTLQIGQAFPEHGCLKLQCLIRSMSRGEDLRAHRALDDCIALRRVVIAFAWKAGVSLPSLMHSFAVAVDLDSSIAQISVLLKPSQCNAKGSFFNLCPKLGKSYVHVQAARS